jgi:hypothetical protein
MKTRRFSMNRLSIIALLSLLVLSGCVSREQADEKLAKGCAAGVQSLLPDGVKIDHIAGKEASKSPEGPDMRYIKIKTVTIDGVLPEDKDYECIFEEEFGFMNASYTASIYQVRTGDATYGKSGNEIMGNADDFLKLTDAVRQAMYSDDKASAVKAADGAGNP